MNAHMRSSLSVTSALDGGGGGQRHAPATLLQEEKAGTHRIGGWAGARADLDGRGKSRPPQRDLIPGPPSS